MADKAVSNHIHTEDDEEDSNKPMVGVPCFWNICRLAAAYAAYINEDDEDDLDTHEKSTYTNNNNKMIPNITDGTMPDGRPSQVQADTTTTNGFEPHLPNGTNDISDGSDTTRSSVDTSSTASTTTATSGEPHTDDDRSETLSELNDRAMPLIIQEYGNVSEPGEEEEHMVAEIDASYYQEVSIIGVAHLTTHRLTFHASVLHTPAGEDPETEVIKAGPATFHRRGLAPKKRLWLELYHDMITMFRASNDEDRVRPFRTISLSAMKSIDPIDPAHPQSITIVYKTAWGVKSGVVEFDTMESASNWRKELNGALHLYRQGRQALIDQSSATSLSPAPSSSPSSSSSSSSVNEEDGVRLCIPLHRITSLESRSWASHISAVTMDLAASSDELVVKTKQNKKKNTIAHADSDVEEKAVETETEWRQMDFDKTLPPAASFTLNTLASSPDAPPTTLTMVFLDDFDPGLLHRTIETAKQRRRRSESTSTGAVMSNADEIVVDFGGLSPAFRDDGVTGEEGGGGGEGKEKETEKKKKEKEKDGYDDDVSGRMRRKFGLGQDDVVWYTKCGVSNKLIRSIGYLIISPRFICFWSNGLMSEKLLRFPAHDVNHADAILPPPSRNTHLHLPTISHGINLQVKEHPDVKLSFRSKERRDEAEARINETAGKAKERRETLRVQSQQKQEQEQQEEEDGKKMSELERPAPLPGFSSTTAANVMGQSFQVESPGRIEGEQPPAFLPTDAPASSTLDPAPTPPPPPTASGSVTHQLAPMSKLISRSQTRTVPADLLPYVPKMINMPPEYMRLRISPQHFTCLTIGSRGDVQPYIALCLGLMEEGHKTTIVTHEEYKVWVEGYGIEHLTAGGDPGALMKLSVDHKMFSPQFFKEGLGHFRTWLDELLVDAYNQVKASGATVLIESPSATAGVHIAEALDIPYFRAFTMPWSRTTEYPHAFLSPPEIVARSLNYSSYVVFDRVIWKAMSRHINKWRKETMGLGKTDLEHMAQAKIPFLYNFSSHVVPKPLDWSDTTMITGYWFLDDSDSDWTAPDTLLAFIAKARSDRKPLVYIGFGSIVVPKPKAMTRNIVEAVKQSDVRVILNKGWSARNVAGGASETEASEPEPELPDEIYSVDKVPHDWLFPQIDAAMHHGGAGTTGASLRAGLPTIIKPWFGDQFFWASRVHKLGAGLKVSTLSTEAIAEALKRATTDRVINERAQAVGEKIRAENGVQTAIQSLYTYLHRAGVRTVPLRPLETPSRQGRTSWSLKR